MTRPDSHDPDEEGQWLGFLKHIVNKVLSPAETEEANPPNLIDGIITSAANVVPAKPTIKEITMIQASALKDTLQTFVSSAADVQGAALVSPDGLPLTTVLPSNMDEERTSAMSAAMLSLGERIGQELARGVVERIYVEGEKGYSIMVGCGEDAVLLVLASKEAKQGLVLLEIKRLVNQLTPLLN